MTNVAETDATAISDDRLAEMLAGLEGVTPGPWHEGDGWVFVPPENAAENRTMALRNILRDVDERQKNTAHITRCDPNTIRSLITELQERRRNTLPASVTDERVEVAVSAYCASLHDLMHRKMRDALEASSIPSSRDDAQVGVKALEWTKPRGWPIEAKSVVGSYKIWAGKDLHLGHEWLGETHHASVDAAKAAAQSDYAQRILSALEAAQKPIDRATVIEECAKVAKSWEATSRKLADASNGFEKKLHHELVADMASDIASSIRALTDKEPTNV